MRPQHGLKARILLTVAVAVTLGVLVGFFLRDPHPDIDARTDEFLAAYNARRHAGGAGAALPPLDWAAARALVTAHWTLADLDRLHRATATITTAKRAVAPAIVPPDGVGWDLALARSVRARDGRPPELATAPAVDAATAALAATVASGPLRPLDAILGARAPDGASTVLDALRALRARARAEVRAALPSHDPDTTDPLADRLAFGAAPAGLTPAELDHVLGPVDAAPK